MNKSKTSNHIITVNPGSTSTKLSLFCDTKCIANYEINKSCKSGLTAEEHDDAIADYISQIDLFLASEGKIKVSAIVGRGGFINRSHRPVAGGVYWVARQGEVFTDIVQGVTKDPELDHASNLGIPIAARYAKTHGIDAFTVDPVVADDFTSMARFSGYAGIERKSTAHVLSVKAMGRKAAESMGISLDNSRLVVVHMGGGITVAALQNGKLVDNNIALLGGGPFTPQRAGTLPLKGIIDLCFSGKFDQKGMITEFAKRGGLTSYLQEDDFRIIEDRISNGDSQAKEVVKAMAYQICKEVGAMAIATGGNLDGLVFSGGLVKSDMFMEMIRGWVKHLAPIIIYKENVEMEAMALGALRVLQGDEDAKIYHLTS